MSIVQYFNLVAGGTFSNCITGPLSNAVFPRTFNQQTDKYWNMINNKGPTEIALGAVIVKCSEEAPVVSAISFVNRVGYKVTVRICVHSFTGFSSCNFESCMQLDLTAMNATSVEGQMTKAEPDIKLKDFVSCSKMHKLSLPHGGCTGVGFGGHFQSIAWSLKAQSFGLVVGGSLHSTLKKPSKTATCSLSVVVTSPSASFSRRTT